ncbi:MAG: class I SAM-dependent methyltransferase [Candidatus Promineifilaceae bacterium]
MPPSAHHPTRGRGLLEGHLARLRAGRANRLIPDRLRAGRILDIGCGSYPYFLAHTSFRHKVALERSQPAVAVPDIQWHSLDLNDCPGLPFEAADFSVVTMLAVAEHLNPDALISLLAEIHRVLEPGGMAILTTPAAWSDTLLRWMARLCLVSAEEIQEHTFSYTLPLLGWCFGRAGFALRQVRFGYFELFLNLWATAGR